MKKGKFISGTILSALSAVCFGFGSYFLYIGYNSADLGAAIVSIVTIPIAMILYAVQYLTGVIAEVQLWSNVRKKGPAKTASIVIAIVSAVLMLGSIILFIIRVYAV